MSKSDFRPPYAYKSAGEQASESSGLGSEISGQKGSGIDERKPCHVGQEKLELRAGRSTFLFST